MKQEFYAFVKAFIFTHLLLISFFPLAAVQANIPVNGDDYINAPGDVCPTVQNTPSFTIVYGTVSMNGSTAPVGSLVKAYSPRNDLVGCFSVTSAGNYGAMYIYGEDTSVIPSISGMRANEVVTFTIEDISAISTPIFQWTNDKDIHSVNIASQGVSASFSATPMNGAAPLIVQFTDSSGGSIDSWQWNFGDGQSSTDRNPQHTYITPGFYTVSLTVRGAAGFDTETRINYISVFSAVNANFTANQVSGVAPLTVTFTNQTIGDFTSLNWTFGDGSTSTSANPIHTYTSGGTYTVSLTASGQGGSDVETKINFITVYSSLTANFTANPWSGIAPLAVSFTNSSTGDYSNLTWDFGDGSPTSNEPNPTNIYATGGVFTVTLTASGIGGEDTQTHTITVYQPVQADFVADSTLGTLPFLVQFQNQSTGDCETIVWNFGDGTPTSTDENPTHSFTKPGIFSVTLTISGLGGTDIETKTGYITVLPRFIFLPIVIR